MFACFCPSKDHDFKRDFYRAEFYHKIREKLRKALCITHFLSLRHKSRAQQASKHLVSKRDMGSIVPPGTKTGVSRPNEISITSKNESVLL